MSSGWGMERHDNISARQQMIGHKVFHNIIEINDYLLFSFFGWFLGDLGSNSNIIFITRTVLRFIYVKVRIIHVHHTFLRETHSALFLGLRWWAVVREGGGRWCSYIYSTVCTLLNAPHTEDSRALRTHRKQQQTGAGGGLHNRPLFCDDTISL